jgi:V/A-type H+-transporting ATPase subunit F
MHKIAAIGDRESVSGFKAIGMEVFIPDNKEDCRKILEALCINDYAIIYITEEQAQFCNDVIKKYEDSICPAIILIPGVRNNTGEGMKQLNRRVEKAVGSQLPE